MPVVHHHVEHPDGTPAVLLDVHIDLITGDQSRIAFRRSDRTGLAAKVELDPDGAGWTVPLVPSRDIQPTGSVYRATVHIEDAPRLVWHFRVPDTGGPYEIVDLLVDPPTGPQALVIGSAAAGIAIHNADPTAHPDIRALLAGDGPGAATRLTGIPTAITALSGHRVVTPSIDGRVGYASNTNPAHTHVPLWITLTAAVGDGEISVLKLGDVTEFSWNWTPGLPVFLGADGAVTQVPPARASGALFSAQLGVATSSTVINVDRQPSIVLAP